MSSNITSKSLGEEFSLGWRSLFYLVLPNESRFKSVAEVPKYVDKAVPFFVMAIILEIMILLIKGEKKKIMRSDDAFSSLGAGIISLLPLLLFRNIEGAAYMYVYEHYRIYELPWDSPWTWILCMLGVDLGYYWVHRMAHEINFMWAGHQTHHSSEEYNLTTALRQSVLQRYSSWIFYLPMAFFVPPSVFVTHIQFNLLYQFWIHTEVVDRLGPLEWILNTPSHHRVHHGRNRYCIDKNYAGVLIIWDRMFGTFEPERDDDKIAYGLVHPLKSWNPIHVQLCHWKYIIRRAYKIEGLRNKMSVFLKGPGWGPGKPRLGLSKDLPDIHGPQPKYRTPVSVWLHVYAWVHFTIALVGNRLLAQNREVLSTPVIIGGILFLLWILTNIGFLYEKKSFAAASELLRTASYIFAETFFCGDGSCNPLLDYIRALHYLSFALWLYQTSKQFRVKSKAE